MVWFSLQRTVLDTAAWVLRQKQVAWAGHWYSRESVMSGVVSGELGAVALRLMYRACQSPEPWTGAILAPATDFLWVWGLTLERHILWLWFSTLILLATQSFQGCRGNGGGEESCAPYLPSWNPTQRKSSEIWKRILVSAGKMH